MKLKITLVIGLIAIGVIVYYSAILGGQDGVLPEPAYASPSLGDDNAIITIEEWGDYQCTFCKRFHGSSLDVIKERFIDSGKVRLVFMDFPLNGPASVDAAVASHCAGDQDSYWEYHDTLYDNWAGENTGWISSESLKGFAADLNLDLDVFAECMDSAKYRDRVLESYQYGQSKGIDSTPSFLISNGDKVFKVRGNQPLDVFLRVFDEL